MNATTIVAFAHLLAQHPEVRAISREYLACDGGEKDAIVVSTDAPSSCASLDGGAFHCRAERTTDYRTFCGPSTDAAPAWLAELGPNLPLTVRPVREGPVPALLAGGDTDVFLFVRTPSGWKKLDEAVSDILSPRDLVTLDATPLVGHPSVVALATMYSGGSESGEFTTELFLIEDAGGEIILRSRLAVGFFQWLLPAQDRARCRGCAGSYDARPHVEVRLTPTIDKGALRLRKTENLRRLSYMCDPREIARGRQNEDSLCPIEDVHHVQRNAGVWRYRDGALVR